MGTPSSDGTERDQSRRGSEGVRVLIDYAAWAGADEIPAMPNCTVAQCDIQSGNVGTLAYKYKIFPCCT